MEYRNKNLIEVGDEVHFPVRESSSCFLRTGRIESFGANGNNGFTVVVIVAKETGRRNFRFCKDVVKAI